MLNCSFYGDLCLLISLAKVKVLEVANGCMPCESGRFEGGPIAREVGWDRIPLRTVRSRFTAWRDLDGMPESELLLFGGGEVVG